MKRVISALLALCIVFSVYGVCFCEDSGNIRLIIRGDDLGMTQGSLVAFERAFNEGILTCASIQTCAPWFEAAAELCVDNPGWCIGLHLSLVGEWRGYRWRPVLPWDSVSSIVDEDGYLYTAPSEPSLWTFFLPLRNRVFKGGAYGGSLSECRAASRFYEQSVDYHYSIGLRIVREIP